MDNKIKILRKVVETDSVLLHGSARIFDEIRPCFTGTEMAVCATPYPEIATPFAVFRACTVGLKKYTFRYKLIKFDTVEFEVCEGIIDQLLNNTIVAYVYALDKDPFIVINKLEYRAYESFYTDRRMSVTRESLPFFPIAGQTHYLVKLNHAVLHAF